MEFIFESRFGSLMEGISGQFGTTPLGIMLFIIAIAILPVGLTVIYRMQRRRLQRTREAKSEAIVDKRSGSLGLSPADRDLIERLIAATESPETGYLLLFDEHRFNRAAASLMTQDPALGETSIASLRVRLGFRRREEIIPRSTTMIPEGSTLLMRPDKQKGFYKAIVTTIRSDGFEIRLKGGYLPVPGDSALFQFQNRSGTYLFKSYCLKRDGKSLLIRHQEQFKKRQQRNYFRSPFTATVRVGYFDKDERNYSRFIELGGGGGTILNPENTFQVDDFLELSFVPATGQDRLDLRGRVIRSSKGGRQLHLVFEGLSEIQRDRILGSLFKPVSHSS